MKLLVKLVGVALMAGVVFGLIDAGTTVNLLACLAGFCMVIL